MDRGTTGRYEVTSVAGEAVRAFVPHPLPPDPPLDLDRGLQGLLEDATLSLGRLDGAATRLPAPDYLLYSYVRKEAVLSSQIEGTQSSLSDLLLLELDEVPGVPTDDVVEVANYVGALQHGLERIRGGFPISSRLIRELHEILLRSRRGSTREPGQFRRSQNWLGGTRPGNAAFVPPPHNRVPHCVAELERFLHDEEAQASELVRAALVHVQFETIHPFLDGNGRVGRLLITLMLCASGMLKQPLLYLSLFLKENRARYYELLDQVRYAGDWEAWLSFFLEGVCVTAEGAVATERRLTELFANHGHELKRAGRRAGSALRVHETFQRRPVLTIGDASELTGLSFPTVSSAIEVLEGAGIIEEVTGRKRGRVYAYRAYLDVLNEGMEPL